MSLGGPGTSDGPLAEYGALRAEILHWSQQMASLLALHVAVAGAVLSYALAASGRQYVALVLPVLSYLVTVRYQYVYQAILFVGRYIQEELDGRVPGGLGWEAWSTSHSRQ